MQFQQIKKKEKNRRLAKAYTLKEGAPIIYETLINYFMHSHFIMRNTNIAEDCSQCNHIRGCRRQITIVQLFAAW